MQRFLRRLLAWGSAILFLLGTTVAVAEQRIALVIGNETYANSPLANPVNDAEDMAETLESLGFDVNIVLDGNRAKMQQAIGQFGADLLADKDAVGLFYYAGHGISMKGINYLLPIGSDYAAAQEITDYGIDIDKVMQNLGPAKARLSMVILDACRNNPFGDRSKESLIRDGLSRMFAPSSTLIAYATTPGATASDGGRDNGLYTSHLISSMRIPGLTLEQVFKRTRAEVEMESGAAQSPREESSLTGADFYFLPLDKAADVNPQAVELAHWQSISRSEDALDFEVFLKKYPKGQFAEVAQSKLAKLEGIKASDPGLQLAGLAQTAIQRGALNDAESMFNKLIESKRPTDKARGHEGLADLALRQGELDAAEQQADMALKYRANSSAALLVKAQIAHQRGDSAAVGQLLAVASDDSAAADFPWQRGLALVTRANVVRDSDPKLAKASYQAALAVDPQSQEALNNLAVLLRDTGAPAEAIKLLKDRANPSDSATQALMYQISRQMRDRNDVERQKLINQTVSDLMVQFEQQKSRPAPVDDWTTRPMSVSVLGFQQKSAPIAGRLGLEDLLTEELGRELSAQNVIVVDRAMIDKLLTELKLGSSDLADPETQLRLGKLTAAQLIVVGNVYQMSGKPVVSMRLIDTETSRVVKSLTKRLSGELDPMFLAQQLAAESADIITQNYPRRGRIAFVDDEAVIINLGAEHGVLVGDMYNVVSEPKEIVFNGKVLGKKQKTLGRVRIAAVEEGMAYAVPVAKESPFEENMRVEQLGLMVSGAKL